MFPAFRTIKIRRQIIRAGMKSMNRTNNVDGGSANRLITMMSAFKFSTRLARFLNRRWSRLKKPGEDLIALPGKGEIFSGDSTVVMRGERQRHFVEPDVNIRMMVELLRSLGDPVDEINAF